MKKMRFPEKFKKDPVENLSQKNVTPKEIEAGVDNQGWTVDSRLMLLRNQMPFLPIIPFPGTSKIVTFDDATVSNYTLNLPDSVKLIQFGYSAGFSFVVCLNGNPDSVEPNTATTVRESDCGGIVNPDPSTFFSVEGVKSVSLRNISGAGVVSVNCFIQQ